MERLGDSGASDVEEVFLAGGFGRIIWMWRKRARIGLSPQGLAGKVTGGGQYLPSRCVRCTAAIRPSAEKTQDLNQKAEVMNLAGNRDLKNVIWKIGILKKQFIMHRRKSGMKLVILEPLGVEQEKLLALAEEKLGGKGGNQAVMILASQMRMTLAERAKDADIVVFPICPSGGRCMEAARPENDFRRVHGCGSCGYGLLPGEGILVSNCAGYSNTAVSELVFGMVLSLYRRIVSLRSGGAGGKRTKPVLSGWSWRERTFGIIGMGAIGTRTAQLADAFGCQGARL